MKKVFTLLLASALFSSMAWADSSTTKRDGDVASTTVGGTTMYFSTLQEAIDAASSQTIELLADVTETVTISGTKGLTINGNNHTITSNTTTTGGSNPICIRLASTGEVFLNQLNLYATASGYPVYITAAANLTINEGVIAGGGQFDGYCSVYFKPGSKGTVMSAVGTTFNATNNFDGQWNGFGMFAIKDYNIKITLTDCHMDASATGTAKHAIILASTEEGFDTSSSDPGFDVTINGSNTTATGVLLYNNGYTRDTYHKSSLKINAGTYTLGCTNYDFTYSVNDNLSTDKDVFVIKGGTYNVDPANVVVTYSSGSSDTYDLVHPDYYSRDDQPITSQNTWTVLPLPYLASVKIDGVTSYCSSASTLASAISNIGSGKTATVKLLDDITSGSTQFAIESGNVTIDLNGHSITESRKGSIVYVSSSNTTVTIQDNVGGGYIKNTYGGTCKGVAVSSYATLNIEGGTIEAGYALYIDYYNTYLNVTGSSVVVKGSVYKDGSGDISITAGKYTDSNVTSYIPNGYVAPLDATDNMYTVRQATASEYVARYNATKYTSLALAMSAANSDKSKTISLLQDVTFSGSLGNYTYSGYTFAGTNTLTVTGNIESNITYFDCPVVVNGTISGGEFAYEPDASKLASNYGVVTKTVTQGSFEVTKYAVVQSKYISSQKITEGSFSFDVSDYNATGTTVLGSGTSYYVAPTEYVSGDKIFAGTYLDYPGSFLASGYSCRGVKDASNVYKYIVGKDMVVNSSYKLVGGTFDFDPEGYYDATVCKKVYNTITKQYTLEVLPGQGVAKIGDTEYASVQLAINAADGVDDIIVLQKTTTESATVNKNIILDLNGCELSSTGKTLTVNANCSLTVNDSKGTGAIKSSSTSSYYGAIQIGGNGATVTVNGGSIYGASAAIKNYSSAYSNTTFNIYGGTLSGQYGIYSTGGSNNVVNVTNGIIGGTSYSIYTSSSTLATKVTGGEFTKDWYEWSYSGKIYTLSGGVYSFDPSTKSNVTFVDGYGSKAIGSKWIVGKNVKVDANGKVTDGIFTFDPSAYVADGVQIKKSDDIWMVGNPIELSIVVYPGEDNPEQTPSAMNFEQWNAKLAAQPNSVAVVESSDDALLFANNTQNIIVHSTDALGADVYTCPNFVLQDKGINKEVRDFFSPVNFTAQKGTYTRSLTSNYNTCCVPFALNDANTTINNADYKVLTYQGYKIVNNTKIAVFDDHTIADMNAQQACLIYSSAAATLTVEFDNTAIVDNENNFKNNCLKGPFVQTDEYADHENVYSLVTGGAKFAKKAAPVVYSFRCVLDLNGQTPMGGQAPTRVSLIDLIDPDGMVTELNEATLQGVDQPIYTTDGKLVGKTVPTSGLYIVNGKVQFIRK